MGVPRNVTGVPVRKDTFVYIIYTIDLQKKKTLTRFIEVEFLQSDVRHIDQSLKDEHCSCYHSFISVFIALGLCLRKAGHLGTEMNWGCMQLRYFPTRAPTRWQHCRWGVVFLWRKSFPRTALTSECDAGWSIGVCASEGWMDDGVGFFNMIWNRKGEAN